MVARSQRRWLTARFIEGLRGLADKRRDFTDPAIRGLLLRVEPTGRKHWLFRFQLNKTPCRLRMGTYPRMTLAKAREVATHYRALVDDGIDPRMPQQIPSERRRDLKRVTLPAVAVAAEVAASADSLHPHSIEFLVAEFKRLFVAVERENPDYVYRVLDNEVLPFWRGRDVRTITPREVIDLLDRIVARGARTMANRTAGILRQLFLFGVHRVIVDSSPVQLLMRPGGREKPRTRVLSDGELRSFLLHYRWAARARALAHMLKILLLTAARRGELCKAKKAHIALDKREWYIPEEIAKNRLPCIIPLSEAATTEFRGLMDLSSESDYVVPQRSGNAHIRPDQLSRRIRRCQSRFQKFGVGGFRAHDLRRTCRTYLSRLGIDQFVGERVLNHKRKGIEGVYDLYDFLPQKRDALEKWAAYLARIEDEATVLPVTPAAAPKPIHSARLLSDDDFAAFVFHYRGVMRTPHLAHLTKILLLTGVEARELAAATWKDIDLEACTWRIAETDTGQARLLALTASAVSELRALKSLTGQAN